MLLDDILHHAAAILQTDPTRADHSTSSCSPDEVTAQNKLERFVKDQDGKESVYDPNYHLCFSAYFNHSHILSSRCTLQSLPPATPHTCTRSHTNKTERDLNSSFVSHCKAIWKGKQRCSTFADVVSLSYCHFSADLWLFADCESFLSSNLKWANFFIVQMVMVIWAFLIFFLYVDKFT